MTKNTARKKIMFTFLGLLVGIGYVAWHFLLLTHFPFVHSDESWLSGLSRTMLLTGNLGTTESFFDLYPRNPHAIKLFFHLLQVSFMKVLGYSLFSFRLISLIFGFLSLIWFYRLVRLLFASPILAWGGVLLLAFDIQFIYASHFARQEIILLFFFLFALHFYFTRCSVGHNSAVSAVSAVPATHCHFILGTLLGISIGFHPNSFIISLPFIFLYAFQVLILKRIRFSALFYFACPLACFALDFILLSMSFDPDFFSHYANYGSQFGVLNPLTTKISNMLGFYQKLYYQVSGTYYTPNIRLQFFLFGLTLILAVFKLSLMLYRRRPSFNPKDSVLSENMISILLCILAVNVGIILIGRFNQTSVLFFFPLYYLLVLSFLDIVKPKKQMGIILLLSLAIAGNSLVNIQPYLAHPYADYLSQISTAVPKDARVLANLNSAYYFDEGSLYDYRNLAYLKENDLDFADYIKNHKIQYIIYPEEMDLIYAQRPRLNPVYGNVYPYYADMQRFLQTDCTLVKTFTHPTYGNRITQYINTKAWSIKIYRVHTFPDETQPTLGLNQA